MGENYKSLSKSERNFSSLKMSSIGTGYDLSTSTFSPDGRVFQVDYAQKAVESSGTAVAIRGKDGVVLQWRKSSPQNSTKSRQIEEFSASIVTLEWRVPVCTQMCVN